MRRYLFLAIAAAGVLVLAAGASARSKGDGDVVTPAGWRVAPAGREIGVSKLATGFQGPTGSALAPGGRYLLSASSGASRFESADLFDLRRAARTDYEPYDAMTAPGRSAFYGVAFAPDGKRAWVSGGGENVVHGLERRGDQLVAKADIPVSHFPAGLAYGDTPNGPRLYVAENLRANATGAGGNPPGHEVAVIDPDAGTVLKEIDLGVPLQPFGVTFTRDGRKAYVTNWMGRSVSVIDASTDTKLGDVALDPDPLRADHPSAITENPVRDEVYTANANSDTVSVIDTVSDTVKATIDVALVPGGPKGSSPEGLDVSPDGRTLFVSLAGENAVAVVDLGGRSVSGFIPTSWYPSDVEVSDDGRQLVVTNTNDSGAGPNPCGPLTPPQSGCPNPRGEAPEDQYSGTMIKGSISVVDVPRNRGQLQKLTNEVMRNNQARARAQRKPKALDAIKHVIYVIKENRTYDHVFGDLPGNGDPRLVLFDDRSAPNHRALARRFGIYDNFYADAEVSADGHNWATQANATDYVDKTWPINYSPRPRGGQRAYDFEDVPLAQQFPTEPLASDPSIPRPAAAQTVGYVWDNAFSHGKSFRSYGEYTKFLGFLPFCAKSGHTSDTTHLKGNTDEQYPGYSLRCSDHADRYPEWKREFDAYATPGGSLPALSIVRLPNDHTDGTRPGSATPEAYMADNDLALGRMAETLSRSRYWKDTVMLVTEDDAQNGPDHVDAHRTLALAISAYTQRGKVDSTHYDTASMLATGEDLLGLAPMSIVDQRVARMWRNFSNTPDLRPYDARVPAVTPFGSPGYDTNAATAPMARQSRKWNTSREDAAPEIALNRAIWKSVKGRHSRMPRPRHVHIIGSRPNDED